MGGQEGNGRKARSGRQAAHNFGISRSRLGWLSVRFEGGPSYPEMVDMLKEMVDRFGGLVNRGERISGSEWLRRIDESSKRITERQRQMVHTLMEDN